MPPSRCASCPLCGSNLAESLEPYQEPEPHDFSSVAEVMTPAGLQQETRCRWCDRSPSEVAKRQGE